MAVNLVNGNAYDFTQIQVSIGGVSIVSASAVNYTETQEKVNNYGQGNEPVSRGQGIIERTGSIDISMSDIQVLRAESANGSVLQLPPFDIIVVFGNPVNPTVHVLTECEFLDDGVETAQGDTEVKRTFNLIIGNIQYN